MIDNPRTTIAGVIGAIGLGLQAIDGLSATFRAVFFVVAALAVAAMGLLARDRHVPVALPSPSVPTSPSATPKSPEGAP